MNSKVKEWLKRYLPAEIISILATLLAGIFTFQITNNNLLTAFAATWAGNIGYFGYIFIKDILTTANTCKAESTHYSIQNFYKNIQGLAMEFGIAELFDSFLIRPALSYYLPIWLNNLPLGILIAKLLADITFYIPAIIGYEMRKKYLK